MNRDDNKMNFFKLFLFWTIGFRRGCLTLALQYALAMKLSKTHTSWLRLTAGLACLLWLGAHAARATDRYVSPYGTNDYAHGYTNWVGAATNIQDAVFIAASGDRVLVTNGVYYFTNSTAYVASDWNMDGSTDGIRTNFSLVCITNRLTVQSMNGPTDTIIEGYQYGTYTYRTNANGVLLAYNSTLMGFTVRNCSTTNGVEKWVVRAGGGIRIHQGGTISNCIITGCSATHGGGVFIWPSGTVYNLVSSNNAATAAGGGLYLNRCNAGIVRDSIICDNRIISSGQNEAGGIEVYNSTLLVISNCVVTRNTANIGGGILSRAGGSVVNCQIVSNISLTAGSVGGYYAYVDGNNIILNSIISYNTGYGVQFNQSGAGSMNSSVKNCLISSNSSYGIYVTIPSNVVSVVDGCTVVKNGGGGIYAEGRTNPISVLNCIIYSNSIADIKLSTATNTIFFNCCATNNLPATQGNITSNPQFVDLENANYRLRANSPCVNTGTNQDWMTNAVDLGGRARIRYGTVDMGAYEVIYNGTIFKF